MRYFAAMLACFVATPAAAQEAENPLDAFAPLIGHCYEAEVGDGGVDRNCWSALPDGFSVRQEQVHIGGGLDGQTALAVYTFNPETGRASFVYRNALGSSSRGSVIARDGELLFPDEIYQLPDGTKIRSDGRWMISGPDAYSTRFREQIFGEWSEEVGYDYRRVEAD